MKIASDRGGRGKPASSPFSQLAKWVGHGGESGTRAGWLRESAIGSWELRLGLRPVCAPI